MSYEPTNWQAGDTVTSAKLNKMEQGIAAGGRILIVHQDNNGVLDKTWQEIHDADVCYIILQYQNAKFLGVVVESVVTEDYKIIILTSDQEDIIRAIYHSNSPDDYPIYFNPNEEEEDDEGGGAE